MKQIPKRGPQMARTSAASAELARAAERFGTGHLDQAEAACRRALRYEADQAIAHLMLGEIALARRDWPRAVSAIRQALVLEPENALGHFTLARALHLSLDAAAARASYETVLRLSPDFALAHSNLAMLLFEAGESEAAAAAARRATELEPDLAEAHLHLGRALLALRHLPDAEAALRRATALAPDQPLAHSALGRTLQQRGKSDAAIVSHRRSLELEPRAASGWSGLGQALRALGRFDEAVTSFLRAIELDPLAGEAHRDLAICRKAVGGEPQLAEMAKLLADPDTPARQRVSAGFGLGKALDDLGRYDEAFARYSEANSLCRIEAHKRGKRFTIEALRAEVDAQIKAFTPELLQRTRGFGTASDLPVFVVGLYRSGTTLAEQILASHPQVFGAGEIFDIRRLAEGLAPHPRQAELLTEAEVRNAAAAHLAGLRDRGGAALRVVDKFPDNLFSLGLIAMLFPGARVIICRRDARDNVLSCFFQNFSDGAGFATDLVDCGRRYLETERMAAHWRQVLPIRMLELQYETLVGDLEGQARRMIDFLGLDWDPACLRFFETERTVNTSSVWQVRQPIYGSSVGRWRNYERHLQPLIDTLGQHQLK
jgi:tetratricopeptide (TPR) repeat protein